MSGLFVFWLLVLAALLLVYALCAIQCFHAWGLIVKVDSMAKNVGDFVTVSFAPVPAEAVVTDPVYVFSSPESFEATADANIFKAIAPATGATVTVKAKAVDGSFVFGTSEAFDVGFAPVIATGLTVSVA
jgi:hypothetical protein